MKNVVKFRRQYSGYVGKAYQPIGGWPKSQTVPDMNLSVKTLMERHTRGIEVGVESKQEYYEDDIGGEVPRHEDINDVHEAKQALQDKADALSKQIAMEREERKARELAQQLYHEEAKPPHKSDEKED